MSAVTIIPFVSTAACTVSARALLFHPALLMVVIVEFTETNQETKSTTTRKLTKSYSPGGI